MLLDDWLINQKGISFDLIGKVPFQVAEKYNNGLHKLPPMGGESIGHDMNGTKLKIYSICT